MKPCIPRSGGFDESLAFLREGYDFISSRCERLQTDLFRTRLMLTPVVCMRGAEAAGLFYGQGRFTRVGAMPRSVLHLLQDKGSVQTLDGAPHRHRKQMFMAMMTPDALSRMTDLFRIEWQAAVRRWDGREVVLHDAMLEILARAGAAWAGVPLAEEVVADRTREFAAMVEQAGSIGPANWWAQHLRRRSERWWQATIRQIREGSLAVQPGSPAGLITGHRDEHGQLLDDAIAAVELLNVVRPIVAVARFITFTALALHQHPDWHSRFASGGEDDLEPFVQEIRRYYPFFPVIGGKVRESFAWRGHGFAEGDWVLLDLYGTNHDRRLWQEPDAFRPERFRGWPGDPNTLVAQGAADFETGHRCPGEWLTIAVLKEAIRQLAHDTSYEVPAQDLTIRPDRMPALPETGFIIRQARPAIH
ncbi:cytochrome P450 [Geminicoccus roseus]|uniref:cytochrome P450 n=1 Tax=Geminicoccus roseus TaxID=404900 RepID=UPI0003FAC2B9|nr:cytochrome P450 [Geminicoccus roseus]